MSEDAIARSRRGLGAWVRSVGASTGRGLRKATPYGIYAFLTAAAVAPLAGPALGAAGEFEIALDQLGGIGTNHLATVMANTADDLRARGGRVGDEQWRDALAEALSERLGSDSALVDEVRAVLRAVDGVEHALAESAEHARDLHLELLTAAAALHREFGDVRWTLAEVRDLVARSSETIADVQRELVERRERERADGRFTQRVLVGLTRMRLALRQPTPAVPGGPCPYPGLAGHQAEDAPWFFGRDDVVDELVAGIAERQGDGTPLLIVGASGVGKSSLLRAGLLPALAADGVPGSAAWPVVAFAPGQDPVADLAAHTATVARVAAVNLRHDPSGYGALARQAALRGGPDARLVVVVDAVEQLFTSADPESRAAFFAALASARSTAVVVLAVRGDLFERCAEVPELAEAVARPCVLGPMTNAELHEVITKPAERVGVPVEPGLPERLLADLGARADGGALPLLAHALRATWFARDSPPLTLAAYQATGGIGRAVAASAEALYDGAGPDGQRLLEATLPSMVTIVDDRTEVRRRVFRDALPEAVLAPWIAARLITADQDFVQFSHEALLSAWPRLAGWIARDRGRLAARQRLDDAAREWAGQNRPADLLYRGERLAEARSVARHELSPHEREFVAAGARAQRVRSLVSGGFLTVLVVITVVAVVASLLASSARTDAERETTLSTSRQLAAESLTTAPSDGQAARGLAVSAWATAQTPEARGALVSASMLPSRRTVELTDGPLTVLDTDPAGAFAAVAVGEGRVELVDIASGERRGLTGFTSTVTELRFSPDGALVAGGALQRDGVRVWRVSDGAPVVTAMAAGEVDWRPDGAAFAAIDIEHGGLAIGVWDAATGEQLTRFGQSETLINAIRYDGTGDRVAAAYGDGSVRVWSVSDARLVATVAPPRGAAALTLIATSGDLLATSAYETSTIRLWSLRTGRAVREISTGTDKVGLVEFGAGGRELVTSSGSTARRWDVGTGAQTAQHAALADPVLALAVSDDGLSIVMGSTVGTVTRLRRSGTWYSARHASAIAVAADPGRGQVTATYADGSWHAIDAGDRGFAAQGDVGALAPKVRHGPDGTRFLLGANGVLDRGDRRTEPDGFGYEGGGFAVSPDGALVAAVLAEKVSLDNLTPKVELRVWSADDLSVRTRITVSRAVSMVFTRTTLRIAVTDNLLRGWETAKFAELPPIPLPGTVYGMAATPDGGHLVVATTRLHVIDLATGTVVRDFGEHPSRVRTLAVSPDGVIATGTVEDAVIRLWDLRDGALIAHYTGHASGSLNQVDFIDGGRTLISAGSDGDVGFWPLDPRQALRSVCADLAPERPDGC